MTIQFCVITYVIASELARQLVLVGSTTRCPRSPERRKFSVVSFFSFCSLPLTALCYFSFDSLLWNKVVQATWAFVVSIEAPAPVQKLNYKPLYCPACQCFVEKNFIHCTSYVLLPLSLRSLAVFKQFEGARKAEKPCGAWDRDNTAPFRSFTALYTRVQTA